MILRKNPRVDLDRYRGVFLTLGLIMSLSLVLIAFEWKFYDELATVNLAQDANFEEIDELEIPNTEQPPPPPKTILEQPEIVEVKNEEEIIQDLEINLDVELNEHVAPTRSVFSNDGAAVQAPPPPPEEKEDEIFLVVEEKPEPNGGYEAFYKFIGENLKYPSAATRMGIEGRVFLQFVVDKEGRIKDVQVVKGIGSGCDEEAARVLSIAPNWKPGKQRGRPVHVKMTLPIIFKLVNR
ncbi:MAG: TonB family protein [Bacteroidia bacterium]|nr:TonB family protein [Bacteroidia bacterium]